MKQIIDFAFERSRVVVLSFVILLIIGSLAYLDIPKESNPDVKVPILMVNVQHDGISAEDAEYLLLRPMEKEFQLLNGLNKMTSFAGDGYAHIMLKFTAGVDPDKALADLREKVEIAKSRLPADTKEPKIIEINVALFPILSISLSASSVSERELIKIAKKLRDQLESINEILKADISGDREEIIEIMIDPAAIESYNITFSDILQATRNNISVPGGKIGTDAGQIFLKIPGIIQNIDQLTALPIKVVDDTVISFKDLTKIRRVFKDADNFARVDGNPAILLSISKRLGANIIQAVDKAKYVVEEARKRLPDDIQINLMQDQSVYIENMLGDLHNNILSAILLVMLIIIWALGIRPALLIGISIPGSFLLGILVIYFMGMTINMIVLFSLILVVGIIVDGAILSVELADRKMSEGMPRKQAYAFASKRMLWPNISSNATTIAVFFPLLFWPGTTGEFMKYLPITVIIVLISSLFMALVFIPVLGGVIGRSEVSDQDMMNESNQMNNADTLDNADKIHDSGSSVNKINNININTMSGFTGVYLRLLNTMLYMPAKVVIIAVILLILSYVGYINLGHGIEFFPKVDANLIKIQISEQGDLSIYEQDRLVKSVEQRLSNMSSVKTLQTNVKSGDQDVIGTIILELVDWEMRKSQSEIIKEINDRLKDLPGIKTEIILESGGPRPPGEKPIQIELISDELDHLLVARDAIKNLIKKMNGFVDIDDDYQSSGVEWHIDIDRADAARFGADVNLLSKTVQMITSGLQISKYQSEDIDIILRFPDHQRSLDRLLQLRVPTNMGNIPMKNFVKFTPHKKRAKIKHVHSKRAITVDANLQDGFLVHDQVKALQREIKEIKNVNPSVSINFAGENQEQAETLSFLVKAFFTALFLMILILLIQFNSFYQMLLILSAIIFSSAGVLLGLLITHTTFGVVMSGIGIIALSGIVINNNIVLIDSFNDLRKSGLDIVPALLNACAQRMRPVLLTSITTIIGLIPMVFGMNIDFINRDISFGAPSTQFWTQLSTTIAGGLAFATILTLLLTPCMMLLAENFIDKIKGRKSL